MMKKITVLSIFMFFVFSFNANCDIPSERPSIKMICVDESNIVNFKKDEKTIATWIYNKDGSIEKKGESIEGWVLGRQYYKNIDASYLNAYIKFKNNQQIDGAFTWKKYDNTIVKNGQYKNGKISGEYREYYEKSGDLKFVENYDENGKRTGKKMTYYEGMVDVLMRETEIEDDKAVRYTEYWPDGKVKEEGRYGNNGYKDGIAKSFNESGEEGQIMYKTGKVIGLGTKENPIDTEAYNKIDELLAALRNEGYIFKFVENVFGVGNNVTTRILGEDFEMVLSFVADKEGMKKMIKNAGTSAAMTKLFLIAQKEQGSLDSYVKDKIIITVAADKKRIKENVFKSLKKIVPGIKKI